jgi:SPP1 gp7 family putative phage head morphogenesis protein
VANKFSPARSTENSYAQQLRKIAVIVAGIVSNHVNGDKLVDANGMMRILQNYSDALTPWAIRVANRMIQAVALRNQQVFNAQARIISQRLRDDRSVQLVVPQLQLEQVNLIKSIPLQAGERAQKLAYEAALDGRRSTEIAEMLANTENVTKSRATLIARTETAKANAMITQARAQEAGIEYYRWETAEDDDVRESHREMANKIFRFSDPPTLSDGTTGNPGEFPNCRCFAVPIIPGVD